MNINSESINVTCVNTKTGFIKTAGGKKPVLILELADEFGEVYVKFFNCNLTLKGNYTSPKNSDFARLYRITTGIEPGNRLSRSNKLLSHFLGKKLVIKYNQFLDRNDGFYSKVVNIKPALPVVNDDWTSSGHVINNVRTNLASTGHNIGINQAYFRHKSGISDQAQGLDDTGLEHDFNPIPHTPSNIGTYNIIDIYRYIDIDKGKKTKKSKTPSPALARGIKSIQPA